MNQKHPNRWLAHLSKAVGEPDKHRAIEILTRRYRTGNETLEFLSRQFSIEEIVREPLPFDGGVYESGGRRIIKINSLMIPVRQEFTLAHEIAHLILESTLQINSSCRADSQLERACDQIAVELLAPTQSFRKFALALGIQSPDKLGTVANRYNISLQAAAVRLYDLGLWKWSVGMWECRPLAREVWFVGKKPWQTECPSFGVFEKALATRDCVCANERFCTGISTEPVALKAYHIGKNFVIAMAATKREVPS